MTDFRKESIFGRMKYSLSSSKQGRIKTANVKRCILIQ